MTVQVNAARDFADDKEVEWQDLLMKVKLQQHHCITIVHVIHCMQFTSRCGCSYIL